MKAGIKWRKSGVTDTINKGKSCQKYEKIRKLMREMAKRPTATFSCKGSDKYWLCNTQYKTACTLKNIILLSGTVRKGYLAPLLILTV